MTIKSAVFGLGLLVGMLAGTAHADTRVALGNVKGRGAGAVGQAALRSLKEQEGVTVLAGREITKAAKRLRVRASTALGRSQLSKSLNIDTWIEGSVEHKKRGGMVAKLRLIGASGQKTLATLTYEARDPKALARIVQDELWRDAGKLIEGAESAGAAEPTATKTTAAREHPPQSRIAATQAEAEREPPHEVNDEAAQEPASAPEARAETGASEHGEELADRAGQAALSPLDIGIGVAGFNRDFQYRDNLSGLRQYGLPLGPTLALNLHWYPAAHFGRGFARNIGIDLRGQLAFGIDSKLEKNVTFPTSSGGFGVGLRARMPVGQHQLAAVVGYDRKTFAIGRPAPAANGEVKHPFIPEAAYSYARLGVELRFAIGDRLSLAQSVAYLHTFSTGMDTWFPRATAAGVEGDLKLGYVVARNFEATAALGVQSFALAFNPTLADASLGRPIAGGAVDQYVSVTLGMLWRMAP